MKKKPILLTRRLKHAQKSSDLILELTSEERKQLRGRKKTLCGIDLLLQLPREGRLLEGEILLGEKDFPRILIREAKENLYEVTAKSFIELMKAIYHLGNRHINLELFENKFFLQEDLVLKRMLLHRGLFIRAIKRTFNPEEGAYLKTH